MNEPAPGAVPKPRADPAGFAARVAAFGQAPGWLLTLLLGLAVGAVAAATRLPRLSNAPPGFLIDEAAAALYAQSINRGHLPIFFGGGTADVREPFFFYLMKLTGTVLGWDVGGARAAAALCGIVAAVACALWYGRALGRVWGLAGGLLVATSFWQLMFSRQAIQPISMAVFAAGGLWLLWEALALPPGASRRRRWAWYAVAGAAFGLGSYTSISFRLIVVAAPAVGTLLLLYRRRALAGDRAAPSLRVDPGGLLVGLLVMLAVMTPLTAYYLKHPDDFTERTEQVRREERSPRILSDPLDAARGYAETLRSFVWDGYDSAKVNQPGRPILDPLLAAWAVAGLAVALRHPLRPLHGIGLLWFAVFILPSALSSPGYPSRALAATPAVFLFPLLAMAALATQAARRGRRALAACGVLIALSIAGSAAWSLHDYFQVWAPSQAAYVAFQGDVRASLEALDDLPDNGEPVYYSTWGLEPLVGYLAPDRPRRDIDGRVSLAVPSEIGGFLVYPTVTAPDPALLALLGDDPPLATGTAPDGSTAWQTRRVDARMRDRLPYVVPPVALVDSYAVVGFDISPDPGPGNQPRVAVTIVWRIAAGAPSYTARVRLVPVGADPTITPPSQADIVVAPSARAVLGTIGREIIVTRLLLDFPAAPEMLADVQVALLGPDGAPLPPLDAPAGASDNFAQLNRVQYRLVVP